MNIQGKLHAIFDVQQVTGTFRKREFVIEYADNPMYPQYVLFQLVQDRCDLINAYQLGDMIDVSFNIRGRMWNSPEGETRYFNSLEAWRINPAQQETQQPQQTQSGMAQPPQQQNTGTATPAPQAVDVTQMDDDDDLPF